MAAFIDENTQFEDSAGIPLTGGKIYIGVKGDIAKGNEIKIFSDRGLTIQLANPQDLNAEGRSTQKIWIGKTLADVRLFEYSLFVEDLESVQHLREDDQGETPASGINVLTNVQNTDAITANSTIGEVDQTLYLFIAIGENNGPVTLNIGGGSRPVIQNSNQEIQKKKFEADQVIMVVFNETACH